MTLTQIAISIFIVDADPMTAASQKCLLEAQEHIVEIIPFGDLPSYIKPQDIVLINMGDDMPQNFVALDALLKRPSRPKLLITTTQQNIFEKGDALKGGASHILFQPFSPSNLLDAVTDLARTTH